MVLGSILRCEKGLYTISNLDRVDLNKFQWKNTKNREVRCLSSIGDFLSPNISMVDGNPFCKVKNDHNGAVLAYTDTHTLTHVFLAITILLDTRNRDSYKNRSRIELIVETKRSPVVRCILKKENI